MSRQMELGQYMTPPWAAQELVAEYFPREDGYAEPSCGRGAFLGAFPAMAPAFGVEIDPELASYASAHTGRPVIVGDFQTVELPLTQVTAIVGNPPFRHATVMRFLDRAWGILPDAGRVGFILPCFILQTASTVARLAEHWSLRQDLLPRNLFPGLKHPICFAVLTKGKAGRLWNFALFHEMHQVTQLPRKYRDLLARGERSVWVAVTIAALDALGGAANLPEIYAAIAPHRPTACAHWREKIRQTLQRVAVRTGRGRWAISSSFPRIAS